MQRALSMILPSFFTLVVGQHAWAEPSLPADLGIQCSSRPETLHQGFLGSFSETGLIKLLRNMKKRDSAMAESLGSEVASLVKRQENVETIRWARIGSGPGHEFALVTMDGYFSVKDAYAGKTWVVLVERLPDAHWKARYIASACANLTAFLPIEFIDSQGKQVLSFEQFARELKVERKDYIVTKNGLKELHLERLLRSALKPLEVKGERFETSTGFNWSTLVFSGRGRLPSDCQACASGSQVTVQLDWTGNQLKVRPHP